MGDELASSFLGAIQASLSVLLIISYGVAASQFNLLGLSASKQISAVCVRIFLPALLISHIGNELHLDTWSRYLPVLIWGTFYATVSMVIGIVLTRTMKLPPWVTPAISFNNTSALPLILIQSLISSGTLDSLLVLPGDNPDAAIRRAKSYFLVNAMVGDTLTFALGPRLLDGEEVPKKKEGATESSNNGQSNGDSGRNGEQREPDEQTSLLPTPVIHAGEHVAERTHSVGQKGWSRLPSWTRKSLGFTSEFFHAPLLGALTGAIIGLVPPLHKAFFANPTEGGVFKAWLTDSIKQVGELFPALMIVVVGVKLSSSLRKMKRGEDSGSVPWLTASIVLTVRFILWPAASVAIIYLFASKTKLLGSDPMLWFAMMMMPTGPSAMKLTALADVTGSGESEKMSIAKFLCLCYLVMPIICFTVAAAMKACQSVMSMS